MSGSRRTRAIVALAAFAPVFAAARADAQGIRPPVPLSARARLDLRVVSAADTAPWSWDAQSRSPLDGSRFMADLTAGEERLGTLYLKGAASWREADDAAGRVDFTIEQGDYLFRRGYRSGAFAARLFGDERRYFTGELGTPLMEDDTVEGFERRTGAALGATHGAIGADYLASALDDGRDTQWLQRGAARVSSRYAHAGVAYQHLAPEQGDDRAVVQAEAAGYWRRLTGVVSFAQSGTGSGFFYPSGTPDNDAPDGSGYLQSAPENSATSLEARLRGVRAADVVIDALYRYEAAGTAYYNELASTRPGSVINTAGLYASHRRYAMEGRLAWRDESRFTLEDSRRRGLEATARAFLRDNSQLLLRAAAQRREFEDVEESDAGLVQAGYRRELQRFMGGVHLLLDEIGDDATPRAAVEARINWSATSAFYARWITAAAAGRPDAVFARLEFRPTGRTWVTFAYGRSEVGDTPYLFDDRDGLPSPDARDVLTLTVRGDF